MAEEASFSATVQDLIVNAKFQLIGLWICAATGNIYAGLYHPIIIAGITFITGSLLLRETHYHRIWDEITRPGA